MANWGAGEAPNTFQDGSYPIDPVFMPVRNVNHSIHVYLQYLTTICYEAFVIVIFFTKMTPTNVTFIADVDGNKIQTIVSKKNITIFKDIVKDGHAFYIKYPIFASQRIGGLRLTRLHHKLIFVHNTVLTECHDFSGPTFGFEFVDYQTLISLVHLQNIAIDVVGLVVAFGGILRDNSDMKKHRLNIQIQDANGLQIHVTLWGHYAYKMQEFIDNNPHGLGIIVILQFATGKVSRDHRIVNKYLSVTKLFINSDINEINVFKKR
ncbi:uncharacterized protein LOC111918633 [Lactuca sativa]|uniref:uncharacterized protein LOC111918633 n=1 Tax=Lactuca sativa TaxID=4236 RepID=UPI000CD8A833|nr:uncharacterized protein LOC111918633 [Lactuca sativa]